MVQLPNISDGDVFYASQTYRLVGSNTNAGTHIGSTTDWTELGSVWCPSGAIHNFVEVCVHANYLSVFNGTGPVDRTVSLRISIGESGAEAVKKTYAQIGKTDGSDNAKYEVTGHNDFFHIYEPTSDEKNNGFNVLVEGTTAGSGFEPPSITMSGLFIKGI